MFSIKTFGRNIRKALLEPGFAAKALLKRTGASLSYRFNKTGKAPLPENITLFLTYKCNLRCNMCGQWGEEGSSKSFGIEKVEKKLELASYVKLLDEVKGFKPHITLFGGEPLLYPEFEQLVVEIKKRGLHLGIITNGTLLKKYAKTLVELGVDVISLSVDGPAKTHDSIRNMQGAYLQIKEGTDELRRLKIEKDVSKPLVNVVCTLSRQNYKNIKEMPAVAEELNADTLNLHHLIFTHSDTLESHNKYFAEKFGVVSTEWEGFITHSAEEINVATMAEDILKLKAGSYSFLLTVYPDFSSKEILKYYADRNFVSKEYQERCLSPWLAAYVYPDGDVMPCNGLGYSAGNLNSDSFKNIWNGEKMRAFRQELKKQKHFQVCPKCTELYRY